MLSTQPGADPYLAYKLHHVARARATWILAEEFGLFEALRDGPASSATVSSAVGIDQRCVAAMLAGCTCLGILGYEAERYFIYDVMKTIVLDGGRARTTAPQPTEDDWWYHSLKASILADEPPQEQLPPWVTHPHDTGVDREAFAPGRHGWRRLWGEALAEAFDFSPYSTIADIGGATGGVLVGLTSRQPHLQGILVELPYSKRTAEAAIAEDEASDRVRFHAADMFADDLPTADVFFMSHVVHDWNDETTLKLLRRCYDALPSDGVMLVQEYMLNDDRSGSLLGVFQWVGMLLGTDGDQRSAADICALLSQVGFSDVGHQPVDHEQSIVIGYKRT